MGAGAGAGGGGSGSSGAVGSADRRSVRSGSTNMSNFSMEVKHDNNDDPNTPGPMLSPAGAAELSERGSRTSSRPWDDERTGQDIAATAAASVAGVAAGAAVVGVAAGAAKEDEEETPEKMPSPLATVGGGGGVVAPISTIVGIEPEAEASTKAFEEMQKKQRLSLSPDAAKDAEVRVF